MKKIIKTIAVMAVAVFAFAGCSQNKTETGKDYTSDELAAIINEIGGENTEFLPAVALDDEEDMNLDFFYEMYEWNPEDFAAGAMSFSLMNISAYNIAVAKPAEGKTDVVKGYFEDYKARIIQNFEGYLPEPLKIAQNAIIGEANGYVLLVMVRDTDDDGNVVKEAQQYYEELSAKLK